MQTLTRNTTEEQIRHAKAIINGKLYDTENADCLCRTDTHSIYKTAKGTLFMTYTGNGMEEQITSVNQENIREAIGELFPDLYIKLFGEPEEA